ncbi:MAG: hypothetical protein FWD59_00835 [Micrococcales bacterium]|nr:hypothetical protein [Micrococcales bacterium]
MIARHARVGRAPFVGLLVVLAGCTQSADVSPEPEGLFDPYFAAISVVGMGSEAQRYLSEAGVLDLFSGGLRDAALHRERFEASYAPPLYLAAALAEADSILGILDAKEKDALFESVGGAAALSETALSHPPDPIDVSVLRRLAKTLGREYDAGLVDLTAIVGELCKEAKPDASLFLAAQAAGVEIETCGSGESPLTWDGIVAQTRLDLARADLDVATACGVAMMLAEASTAADPQDRRRIVADLALEISSKISDETPASTLVMCWHDLSKVWEGDEVSAKAPTHRQAAAMINASLTGGRRAG